MTKEIYISHWAAGAIGRAIDGDQEATEALAEKLFDGNTDDAAGLVDFFRDRKAAALLEEIIYWDSQAGDVYHIWKYFDYCLPLLKEYAERTGYVLRWKAYCEEYGNAFPGDDDASEEGGTPRPRIRLQNVCWDLARAAEELEEIAEEMAKEDRDRREKSLEEAQAQMP